MSQDTLYDYTSDPDSCDEGKSTSTRHSSVAPTRAPPLLSTALAGHHPLFNAARGLWDDAGVVNGTAVPPLTSRVPRITSAEHDEYDQYDFADFDLHPDAEGKVATADDSLGTDTPRSAQFSANAREHAAAASPSPPPASPSSSASDLSLSQSYVRARSASPQRRGAESPLRSLARSASDGRHAVFHHCWRWSHWADSKLSPDAFAAAQPALHTIIASVFDKFVYQLEATTTNGVKGNYHFQGYGHTSKKVRSRQLAVSLHKQLFGINISPASKNGVEALQRYCLKRDTREAGPWADKPIYLGADLPTTLRPWQQQIVDIIDSKADNRTVHWIYEERGNTGKTVFCKYLMYHQRALCLSFATSRDLMHLCTTQREHPAYCFDLPRTKPKDANMEDIYNSLESLKNGILMNSKYLTSITLRSSPHVFVFANYKPDQKRLSLDRWKLYTISSDLRLLDCAAANP